MSFMAGLAEGFANTFNAMEQRRSAHKQDAFRIAYDSYLKKREDYDAAKKADMGFIESAHAAVKLAGHGVPASAWEHAYHALKGGMSMDATVELLRGSTWSAQLSPSMPEMQQ